MNTNHDTVVFLGPSLPVGEARSILAARYEPPARLGSVYEVIGSEVETIVLIDGVFHNEPSVWQREIDAALQAGLTVFGASSMGALRAAELHRFGMIGRGVVFDWYHRGVIDGDDEVALLHGDADAGYRPLSEPMVNIRYTLEQAACAGVFPAALLAPMIAAAKRVFYPQRSFSRLIADLGADPELAEIARPLERYFANERVDLKRRDAISVLQLVAELRRRGDPATVAAMARRPSFVVRNRHGHARLADAWRNHGQKYRLLDHEGRRFTLGEIVVEAGNETVEVPNLGGTGTVTLSPAVRYQLAADRAHRTIAVQHARMHGLVPPAKYLEAVTARLGNEVSIASWIRDCRITRPELAERLADEALIAWFADEVPAEVSRATADCVDPMAGDLDPTAAVGLYLRVFATHAERLACRRVALA
ncbi:MAG TPA: TfuA-like protein, partial [Kofleriaceae bacterium]